MVDWTFKEIFLLTHEAQTLGRKLICDFILLFHKEALFHMGVQATGYERAASGHPDCVTTYYSMIKSKGEGASVKKMKPLTACGKKQVKHGGI